MYFDTHWLARAGASSGDRSYKADESRNATLWDRTARSGARVRAVQITGRSSILACDVGGGQFRVGEQADDHMGGSQGMATSHEREGRLAHAPLRCCAQYCEGRGAYRRPAFAPTSPRLRRAGKASAGKQSEEKSCRPP